MDKEVMSSGCPDFRMYDVIEGLTVGTYMCNKLFGG